MSKINHTSPALWATILAVTLGVAGFSASTLLGHDSIAENHSNPIATLTTTDITKSSANTTDEMVYIITDKTGQPEKILANSFTENQLNETNIIPQTNPPITFDISYQLDGNKISASDLTGKSGHVTITYNFTNHAKYGNYQIPFATITTAILNKNFSNVTVTNGRILDDGTRKVIIGLTFPGLNHNFSANLDLPTTFSISADVTNFQLESTYTLASNQIFSELDTTPLNTVDDLADAMDQLSSSMSQLIAGSSQLQSGLNQLLAGSIQLRDGLNQLLNSTDTLANGINQLNDGLQTLSNKSGELNSGARQIFQGLIDQLNAKTASLQQMQILSEFTIDNYATEIPAAVAKLNYLATLPQYAAYAATFQAAATELAATKPSLDGYNQFYVGLQQYTAGVNTAATGSKTITNNIPALSTGVAKLSDGANQLSNGLSSATTGADQLTAGLQLFNRQGINQLVTAAGTAESFTNDFRATVNASKTYTHFSQPTAQQVSFIYKTPSI